jgi:hypothetical protein
MGILLALASFIALALVDRLVASMARLIVGPLVSAVLLGRDLLTPGRAPKILEVGTTPLVGAWRSTLC